ncbi:hypothetical protein N658DRAFT_432269 [Parathielavia hyrcaniae]|uniref:R3H-associated N-terminal domain-containing protein n=1 Tax=Parathielavia hyrcaniae TaxID=113614 RepID=A0AAN6PUT8_9PEZI|nr:hypothetical protein N658DRAFT_432269 [Parathielavia hyrcaniae]
MAITRTPLVQDEELDQHGQPSQSHPTHAHHQHSLSDASTATVDIEAWTAAALESLSISPIARGTGSVLSIPLDTDHNPAPEFPRNGSEGMKLRGVAFEGDDTDAFGAAITPPRRPPSRRDSMRRRDALLKGKEGSRQRRRWENDRLLHVPNVVPPLPSDWQVRPTHRVLPPVPYQLAQYWDKGLREQYIRRHQQHHQHQHHHSGRHVPRDLRATAKRTPAVKAWLRVLEEPVREWVVERGLAVIATATVTAAATGTADDDDDVETDPDDEEIVFVGRNGRMRDGKPWKKAQRVAGEVVDRGLVLEMEEGGGGAMKRWLTHSISDYYGLESKTAMVGNPARRVVFVGVKQRQKQRGPRQKLPCRPVLPPPLWEMF